MTLKSDLEALASNFHWTWSREASDLLDALPGASRDKHPAVTVSELNEDDLTVLESDSQFRDLVSAAKAQLDLLTSSTRPGVAYLSLEFGLTDRFAQYAGGLGVLAGDHLKAASDLRLPLVGVGLFYRHGVFHQAITGTEQTEYFKSVEPSDVGVVDTGVMVEVPFPGRTVHARVWRTDVGRIPLILLDTDVERNERADREITDALYLGSQQHRIDQELILGVGGGRALHALGWDVGVHHLNEGHAGFITLELIDRVIENGDVQSAVDVIRKGTVFTTHTPVPAGIDRLYHELLLPYLEYWAHRWDVPVTDIWSLGEDPDDADLFNMAAFCLRTSGAANGVSRLHGEVSRGLFSQVSDSAPIGHVTNGVHARTWTSRSAQILFDDVLGSGWADGEVGAWAAAKNISDGDFDEVRRGGAERLAGLADRHGIDLNPDALIIGFARRFAPYKRANLVLKDRERLEAMLADNDRPVHFLFAGKAHPHNEAAKALVAEILHFGSEPEAHGRFSFIPDYDMAVASYLVEGCDIWLNNPVRPREASGTSGQKVALNGGLNCSVLDGWWAEMFDGDNGWAIPASDETSPEARDIEDAVSVVDTLIAARDEYFIDRGAFRDRTRHAWVTLGPKVTAARMVKDYNSELYQPAEPS